MGLPEDVVEVTLWRGYGFRTAREAHDFILWLVSAGEYVEVIADEGGLVTFHAHTLRTLVVAGVKGAQAAR
jgi:hypothetical protein